METKAKRLTKAQLALLRFIAPVANPGAIRQVAEGHLYQTWTTGRAATQWYAAPAFGYSERVDERTVEALRAAGYVEPVPPATYQRARYWLTDAGRAALATQQPQAE